MNQRSRHLLAYAVTMLALIFWQLIFAYAPAVNRLSDYHSDILYSVISQVVCMGVVPFVTLLLLSKKKPKEMLRPMRYKKPRDIKSCVLISLGLMILITPFTMAWNALTQLLFTIFGYKRSHPLGVPYLGIGGFFVMLLITAVLPAVFEEWTHRGVLLSGLEYRGSERSAVLLSALLFGLMHENPAQMLYATAGGIVFAYVVLKTDSIFPAMCAHFANNAISVTLDYCRQRQNALGVWYDSLNDGSVLSVALTFVALAVALYGVVKLMQYAARKAPKPISEYKLFGLFTVDVYNPEGKATIKDNAFLYAVIAMESAVLVFLFFWGVFK